LPFSVKPAISGESIAGSF